MRGFTLFGFLIFSTGVSAAAVAAQGVPGASPGRDLIEQVRTTYVVRFGPGVERAQARGRAVDFARQNGGNLRHFYNVGDFQGFSIEMNEVAYQRLLNALPAGIASITPDGVATIDAPPPGRGNNKDDTGDEPGSDTCDQTIGWNINRLFGTSLASPTCGAGIGDYSGVTTSPKVCILDTGIDLDHPDLRVVQVNSSYNFTRDKSVDDLHGHGSHVAGIVAAIDNNYGMIGVAPGLPVTPIKVLDRRGSGSYSGIMAGVQKAVDVGCDVANLSLGGPAYDPLDELIRASAAGGLHFTLAAGNDSTDITNHSPARASAVNSHTSAERIFTIVSFASDGSFSSFSNYDGVGLSVAEFALPGSSIYSAYKGGGYRTFSGTSMAAPHMAGLIARKLVADVSWDAPYTITTGSVTGPPANKVYPVPTP